MGMNGDNAGALVFDLETLPIEGAEKFIDLEGIEAPSNYKDPVKIRDYIKNATVKAAEKACLDPDLCRIAVLGVLLEHEEEPVVMTAENEAREADLLRMFWNMVTIVAGSHRRTISFYGLSFDWPVIVQRSRYLNVHHVLPSLDKYRTPHIDLHAKLTFNGVTKHTHSLDFYAKRFGLELPEDTIDGSQIGAVIANGDWATAVEHCRLDVLKAAGIARRIGMLAAPKSEAVAS